MLSAALPEAARYVVLRGQCVLLVEPVNGTFAHWRDLLQHVGMQVRTVCGTSEAAACISELTGERLDFALVFEALPDGSSLTVVEQLQTLRPTPEVVMVGDTPSEERMFALWRAKVTLLPTPRTSEGMLSMLLEMQRRRIVHSQAPPAPQPLVLVVEDSAAAAAFARRCSSFRM
jgi:CheY-like chemotaxis protein